MTKPDVCPDKSDAVREAMQVMLRFVEGLSGVDRAHGLIVYDVLLASVSSACAPSSTATTNLDDIEQYRLQMAGICTAALGYWKEGDSIHADYDTPALRDVAKLYAKYDALFQEKSAVRSATALHWIPLLKQAAMQLQWTALFPEHRDVSKEWVEHSATVHSEIAEYLKRCDDIQNAGQK